MTEMTKTTKTRYAADKPKDCRYCYFWEGKKKGCKLGEDQCYYILPEKKPEKKKSPCDGCPYGRVSPCIGYCIRQLQGKKVD